MLYHPAKVHWHQLHPLILSHMRSSTPSNLEATGQQTYLSSEPARMLDHPAEVHWHQLHPLILTLGQQHAAN